MYNNQYINYLYTRNYATDTTATFAQGWVWSILLLPVYKDWYDRWNSYLCTSTGMTGTTATYVQGLV